MTVVHVGQCGFFRKNFGGVTSLSLHLSRRCFYGRSFLRFIQPFLVSISGLC